MNPHRLSRLVFPSLVRTWFVLGLFALFGLLNFTPTLRAQEISPAREPQTHSPQNIFQRASSQRSSIFFVEIVGQFADARVQFQAHLGSSILTVQNKSLVLSVFEPLPERQRKPNAAPLTRQGVNLNFEFVGANKKIKIVPFRRIDTRMSFYLGNNPDRWRTIYQTLFGGGVLDFSSAIAVDSAGNAYVTGLRYSADYDSDAFVVKLDATGALIQTTIFGGAESKDPSAIVVNAEGNAFVSGSTFSPDFAGTGHPYDWDGYVAKFNAMGGLAWAQRLGGTADDSANALAWKDASLLVGGSSGSADWGASIEGSGYLIEVDENGGVGAPEFLNLGAEGTGVFSMTVDDSNQVWVAGAYTSGGDTQGLVQNHSSGQLQTFGGSGAEYAAGVAVDANGNTYVVGATDSTDWAGYHPGDCIGPEIAAESTLPCHDVFVVRFGADGAL